MNSRSITGRSTALLGGFLLASLLTACGGGTEDGAAVATNVDTPAPIAVPTANDTAASSLGQTPVQQAPATQTPVVQTPVQQMPVTPPVQQAPVIGSALLSWQPPTTNTDGSSLSTLAGYRIYYGTDANSLSRVIDVTNPGLTSYTVGDLGAGTYYFAISAYTTDGVEGVKSTVGSKTIS